MAEFIVALIIIVTISTIVIVRGNRRNQRERALAAHLAAQHRANLVARFGEFAADQMARHEVYMGWTMEMVSESLGPPVDVDEQIMKTKARHTFKYMQTGARSFALRVMFEDGVVVGWER